MAGGWDSLGLLPELVDAAEVDFGWRLPTDIQDEAIPLILGGGDVMAAAETGSGKTAAFAMPIVQLCVEAKEAKTRIPKKKKQHPDKSPSSSLQWRMSSLDRDRSIAIDPSSDGRRIQSRDVAKWAGCRASHGVTCGDKEQRWSFACRVLDNGIVRVGWAAEDASLQLGTDGEGYGYGSTGVKVHKKAYTPYGKDNDGLAFGKGDAIGCHVHVLPKPAGKSPKGGHAIAELSFSKNGMWLGKAFDIHESTLGGSALFPSVCVKNAECELLFGADQAFPLPDGYKPIGSVKDEAVKNPKDLVEARSDGDDQQRRGPLAIVIEPTRDLAEQTFRVFDDLSRRIATTRVHAALLVGGMRPEATTEKLKANQVDILVATPPIAASYMKRDTIGATRCRFLVLDEADELITSDSIKNVQAIYSRILAINENRPRVDRLQVCFFSATLENKQVVDLASRICHRPLWIKLRGKNESILPDTVQHCVVEIDPSLFDGEKQQFYRTDAVHRGGNLKAAVTLDKLDDESAQSEKIKQLKMQAVLDIMEAFSMEQVLIFCRTNLDCDLMESFLREQGGGSTMVNKYSCRVLAGMRTMQERQKSLEDFKSGETRILLSTDVGARGIDVRELPFVVNLTLPDSTETYVHRVGRVGRAERRGLAISLVGTAKERVWYCQPGKRPPCQDIRDYKDGVLKNNQYY